MDPAAHQSARAKRTVKGDTTRKQIRGSSLLLAGRILAIGINFATQVLIVRYLSTAGYGALAYALSVVTFLQVFATLGLRETTRRFASIYHKKREYEKFFGTIFLAVGTMVLAGLVIIVAFSALPKLVTRLLIDDQQAICLLYILIFVVPIGALDDLFMRLFASFASPRAIFFRRHVWGPGLKLSVVVLLIVWQREVNFLAYGYLTAGVLGVLLYVWLLIRVLHRQKLFQHLQFKTLQVPLKAIFVFAISLFGSHLLTMTMNSFNVFLLGYFHSTSEVAFFRVVLPVAQLNIMVMRSFGLLYMPEAARLFAAEDYAGIRHLYAQTAGWMAVVTFPVFAATFVLAQPLTLLLYGVRYEQSGVFLALLALGYYFRVVLGFNELTLIALGKLRYILIINGLAAVITVAANLLLISRYGALGAAIGTAGSMIVHNILRQAGLQRALGFSILERQYRSFYLIIACGVLSLFFMQLFRVSSPVALPLVGLVSFGVLMLTKKKLHVAETFPELLKLPLMRQLFR